MKKILILFLFVTCFQTIAAQKVTYGVKGGANFASYIVNYKSPIDYKYKLGFQIGGFAKIKLVERLYLQPELLYSFQGTKYDIDLISLNLPQTIPGSDPLFEDDLENYSVNESTMLLPVMLRYYFTNVFSVEIGPQLDYLFYVHQDHFDYSVDRISGSEKKGGTSEINLGANLGLGYNFNENFAVGVRYHYGFNQLNNNINLTGFNDRTLRNSVFSLSLAYSFN